MEGCHIPKYRQSTHTHVNPLKKKHDREFTALTPREWKQLALDEVQFGPIPFPSPTGARKGASVVVRMSFHPSQAAHFFVEHENRTQPGKTVNQKLHRVPEARKK